MKKRIEQWVIVNRFGEVTHCYDRKAECGEVLLGNNDADGCRVVRLVEADPARDAVVRAAVRFTAASLRWEMFKSMDTSARADRLEVQLRNAVARLKKGGGK